MILATLFYGVIQMLHEINTGYRELAKTHCKHKDELQLENSGFIN